MTDLLRDTYGPWPSDSEPAGSSGPIASMDRLTLGSTLPPYNEPRERPFQITVADAKGEVRFMIDAASLAEALEKAAAAIRR